MTPLTPVDVDPAHVDAVRRRRRIIAHCDANLPGELLGIDLTEWLEPVRIMRSGVWTEHGIDVLDALVAESRRPDAAVRACWP